MNPQLSPGNIAGIATSVAAGIIVNHIYGPVAALLWSIPAYFVGVLCVAFGWLAVSSVRHLIGGHREQRRSR